MEKEEVVKTKTDDLSKLKRSNEKKKAVIVILAFLLALFIMLTCLFYFGIINSGKAEEPKANNDNTNCQCENAPTECNCPANTSSLGEKIGSLKKITLTDKNQTVNVGKTSYKFRMGNGDNADYLMIDDEIANSDTQEKIDVRNAFLTDKFIIFTGSNQFAENIAYVIGEDRKVVGFNNNGYVIAEDSFKLVDGYLHATGGIPYFNGIDMGYDSNDLIIKYIDNTLIVTSAK